MRLERRLFIRLFSHYFSAINRTYWWLITALQVLTGLSQVEQNEESLLECLSADIFTQIVSLARIYDLQLIIASLDTLYYLSELGEGMCEAISLVKHSIGKCMAEHSIIMGCALLAIVTLCFVFGLTVLNLFDQIMCRGVGIDIMRSNIKCGG